ncbi:MAG: hypothetical protein Ct9H300mP27_05110 [Chloroflexota bacterium]|nr:MAG: hypothetical protein Ct9H300mP27_05110 [Chloroflexota bacterium]
MYRRSILATLRLGVAPSPEFVLFNVGAFPAAWFRTVNDAEVLPTINNLQALTIFHDWISRVNLHMTRGDSLVRGNAYLIK